MTDPTTDTPAGFSLDEWIETGTVAHEQVTIYANRALAGEFTALERRLTAAQAAAETGDQTLEESGDVARILEQMEDLYARWEASKAVWTVRALSDDEVRDIYAAHKTPTAPDKPPADAPADVHRAHKGAVEMWTRAVQLATDERNLHYIAAAVTKVETAKGATSTVTVEQLRRMRHRPHGAQDLTRLIDAVNRATQGDVEIARPTLPASSRSDRA